MVLLGGIITTRTFGSAYTDQVALHCQSFGITLTHNTSSLSHPASLIPLILIYIISRNHPLSLSNNYTTDTHSPNHPLSFSRDNKPSAKKYVHAIPTPRQSNLVPFVSNPTHPFLPPRLRYTPNAQSHPVHHGVSQQGTVALLYHCQYRPRLQHGRC